MMSPTVKLTEGADFAFGARWALMQFHPWSTRNYFLEMSDVEVKEYFRDWRQSDRCPWYVKEQYLAENGRRFRGGAGPNARKNTSIALAPDVYEAKLTVMIDAKDYAGAQALQYQQQAALDWRVPAMRKHPLKAATRRSPAAPRRRLTNRLMRTRACSKCFTKATWRRSPNKSNSIRTPGFTTGNTTATATPDARARHRRNRVRCQRA